MLLQGRVAIVTGASSGLGKDTAKLFAEEGAKVLVADITDAAGEQVAQDIRASGGEARYVHVNVRSTADTEAMVRLAEEAYGKLDIVIANAGILGRASMKPTLEITDEEWLEVIDVNLSGVFRTFRAAIPALRRAGGGVLSATSSTAGVYGALNRPAYSASKGGINSLVRALAVELAPDNIRVNAVCPGAMTTGIGRSLGRTPEGAPQAPRPQATSPLKERMTLTSSRDPREVAKVHLFLCSHLASQITGECIVADHGFAMWKGD
jgi:NAD(P)-dependent dehydrogenase (short-subunit alcohol dehydrogenase family)